MKHDLLRDVLTVGGKTAAKCSCGDFHPTHHDTMDTNKTIKPSDIVEIAKKVVPPPQKTTFTTVS